MCFIVAYCVVEFILIMYNILVVCLLCSTLVYLVYFCVQILMNTNLIYLSAGTCEYYVICTCICLLIMSITEQQHDTHVMLSQSWNCKMDVG